MRDEAKLDLARKLRKEMTDAERHLWHRIRGRQLLGAKFRRQHPVGPYVADFACLDPKLIIEVDGGQHNESDTDTVRDACLRRAGFHVLRFWNHDVLTNTEAVLDMIWKTIASAGPHPNLPPQAGEGAKSNDNP